MSATVGAMGAGTDVEADEIEPGTYGPVGRAVIDCYFGGQKGHQLVKHQLDSYNDFVASKLEQIIDGFNPIDMCHQFLPEHMCYKYLLSLRITRPTLSKPTIFEKDGSTKVMMPNDARLRKLTYAAPLHVDVEVKARTFSPETGEYTVEAKRISSVGLGRLPVMVRSRYCMLQQQQVPSSMDECLYDYGGYFIINGNEKVREMFVLAALGLAYFAWARPRRRLRDASPAGGGEPGPHRREPHVRVRQLQGDVVLAHRRDPLGAGGALRRAQDDDAQAHVQGEPGESSLLSKHARLHDAEPGLGIAQVQPGVDGRLSAPLLQERPPVAAGRVVPLDRLHDVHPAGGNAHEGLREIQLAAR